MNAEQLEQEAAKIISADLMRLPPGVHSGTARNLVRLLVDAAVARIAEQQPPSMNAEQLEKEAAQIISADLLRLPPGVHNGTARNLVRLLVDAAVARIAEQKPLEQPPKPARRPAAARR